MTMNVKLSLPMLSRQQGNRGVCCGNSAAIELIGTFTINGLHLCCELLGFIREVASLFRILRDVTRLPVMITTWVHSVTPRRIISAVRIAAIVVVAQAVAPFHHS